MPMKKSVSSRFVLQVIWNEKKRHLTRADKVTTLENKMRLCLNIFHSAVEKLKSPKPPSDAARWVSW